MIDAATLELIETTVRKTVDILRTAPQDTTSAVLTRAEAKAYVKRKSDRAFGRWCKKWQVRSVVHGRYSRTQLDVALSREARMRR